MPSSSPGRRKERESKTERIGLAPPLLGLLREPPDARHDRFQLCFGPGAVLCSPDADFPVHLTHALEHLLDEMSKLWICPTVLKDIRVGRRGTRSGVSGHDVSTVFELSRTREPGSARVAI